MRVGELSEILKWGRTEKSGGETKILKRGQAASKSGCLKKGGWNPLRNNAKIQETNAKYVSFARKY